MARTLFPHLILILALLSSFTLSSATRKDKFLGRPLDRKLSSSGKEKVSKLSFYFHDTVSGKNPSAVPVVKAPSNRSNASFGLIMMMDDPLTSRPELNSKMIGKAEGFYAFASQENIALLMVMNLRFTKGKFNGSTLAIMGRNSATEKVREMPVIGGTGCFRFARGYAQARTHTFNNATGDATVKYNVYVIHY